MKHSEWNERLFNDLVVENGHPNDPLYLYVDAEVLAHVGGFLSPEAALEDFKLAFEGYDFEAANRESVAWMRNGFPEPPPIVIALAMTVLAVTLEPLGETQNIYKRQWELLGGDSTRNNRKNAPAHYEFVQDLWSRWNKYLEGPGNIYGTPTARPGSLRRQGWARSQSFIRPRDKQDIHNFLADCVGDLPDQGAPNEAEHLVRLLSRWLGMQGSRTRLTRAANDPHLVDELGNALVAQRRFWTHEAEERTAQRRRSASRHDALLHWHPQGEELSLILPLSKLEGQAGAVLTDFENQEFTLDPVPPFFYLTGDGSDPETWIFEPVDSFPVSDAIAVSREPKSLYVFEALIGDTDWIEVLKPRTGGHYRVLLGPDTPLPSDKSNLVVDSLSGPVAGFKWLVVGGEQVVSGQALETLFPASTMSPQARNHKLTGGLRLHSHKSEYLHGFEPDVVVDTNREATKLEVLVDGEDVRSPDVLSKGGADLVLVDGTTGALRVSLSQLHLTAGRHEVEVRLGNTRNKSTFTSHDPESPSLPPIRVANHRAEDIARFSLARSKSPSIVVILDNGRAVSLTMSKDLRWWVQGVPYASEAFESFFDSCWFDAVHPLPSQKSEDVLVVVNAGGGAPTFLFTRPVNYNSMVNSPRVSSYIETPSSDLVQIAISKKKRVYLDDCAEARFQEFESKFSRELGSQIGAHFSGRPSVNRHSRPSDAVRRDLESPAVPINPYNDILHWLAESQREGVTVTSAENAFAWLWRRAGLSNVPKFSDTARMLESLGYIHRVGNRVFPQPPSLNWLPDSEALAVVAGARSEGMVSTLESGDGAPTPQQARALQEITPEVLTQMREDTVSGSKVPAAPDTVYVQLGSTHASPEVQAKELGFHFFNPSLQELRGLPTLQDRLEDESARIVLDARSATIDVFTPSTGVTGGRWRGGELPSEDAFLRIQSKGHGARYVWWNSESGSIVSCGWPVGLWGFHRDTATAKLFTRRDDLSEFGIASHMWLPPDMERFLVMRSGLLPRTAIDRAGNEWRVYANVTKTVAEEVCNLLGHPWDSREDGSPAKLINPRFI